MARIWDSKSGKLVVELSKHNDAILSAIFTSDDSRVVTVSVDKHIIIWEITQDEATTAYKAAELHRIETKHYLEI